MKKVFKITIVFITAISLFTALGGCTDEENPVYFYGVASFKTVGSEEGVFAYVPIETCGDIRIYEDYTTLPEGLKEGDVIKMKFNGAPEIRNASVDDVPFLAFWPVPQEITIIASNVTIGRTGNDYLVTIPSDKIENLAPECKKIAVQSNNGDLLYTFYDFTVDDEKAKLTVLSKDGHKVLSMLEYTFIADS